MVSLEAARSFHFLVVILDQRFLESTIQDRIGGRFSRLLLFFRAFLLSLERFSLAVFAGVQDVVHLVSHVSIKGLVKKYRGGSGPEHLEMWLIKNT